MKPWGRPPLSLSADTDSSSTDKVFSINYSANDFILKSEDFQNDARIIIIERWGNIVEHLTVNFIKVKLVKKTDMAWRAGNELLESSRLKFYEKISVTSSPSLAKENKTSGPINRTGRLTFVEHSNSNSW